MIGKLNIGNSSPVSLSEEAYGARVEIYLELGANQKDNGSP